MHIISYNECYYDYHMPGLCMHNEQEIVHNLHMHYCEYDHHLPGICMHNQQQFVHNLHLVDLFMISS